MPNLAPGTFQAHENGAVAWASASNVYVNTTKGAMVYFAQSLYRMLC